MLHWLKIGGLFAWFLLLNRVSLAGGPSLLVSPAGPYTTIQAALADAHNGDEIVVRAGTYAGPLVVDKSVTLTGVDRPVIDGGQEGTVVTLAAPNIYFHGFHIQGSGNEPDRDHAGLILTAPNITVEDNLLTDVLFGVFIAQADNAIVRNNEISSKSQYDTGRKGDSIRLWYSQNALIEDNYIHDARDMVVWYSSNMILRHNLVERNRYGIHLMYADQAQLIANEMVNNSVGIYTMYSHEVTIQDNLIHGQRGPSGYGLGFKDADYVTVTGNVLVDNGGGVFLDGTPFNPQGFSHFQDNILAFNDVGVILLPAVRNNQFDHNTFWENIEQVAIQGGTASGQNVWQNNYWSDYTGFDGDGDGLGDTPYQAERFFEGLTDQEPRLRLLIYSPAAQAIEFAGRAFPIIRPQPKLTDQTPSLVPAPLPDFALSRPGYSPWLMPVIAGGLFLLGLFLAVVGRRPAQPRPNPQLVMDTSPVSIVVQAVSKRYQQNVALDQISLTATPGRAIALWGENGAGKTTLLKAILGLIEFEGQILVGGHDVRRNGKAARRQIGYVPQEIAFNDWTVQATLSFFANLKNAPAGRTPVLLAQMGLNDHATKLVTALSGGLRQRLALAIALLSDPPILLLDEPTANLDAKGRRDYLALLVGLRQAGKSIIFASHRLEEVELLADEVLLLERGRLEQKLTPAGLRQHLSPNIEMTLWLAEEYRALALAALQQQGLAAHLNGRGTVVVSLNANRKMFPLATLSEQGIPVLNFEMEQSWKQD